MPAYDTNTKPSNAILDTIKVKIIKFMKIFRVLMKFIYILIIVHYISHANI